MTFQNAIAIIVSCTFLVGALGTGAGLGLGSLFPAYYRTMASVGRAPGFDPVSYGIGQGLTQGLPMGMIFGLALVGLLCWREVRLQASAKPIIEASGQSLPPAIGHQTALLLIGSFLALALCLSLGVLIGLTASNRGVPQRGTFERYPRSHVDDPFSQISASTEVNSLAEFSAAKPPRGNRRLTQVAY